MNIKEILRISLPLLVMALIIPMATSLLYDVKPAHA